MDGGMMSGARPPAEVVLMIATLPERDALAEVTVNELSELGADLIIADD
ncbi:MAG: hypothetical protein ACJ790_00150 [Myxococcaceae bacterium]